jgi:hypothetical protein
MLREAIVEGAVFLRKDPPVMLTDTGLVLWTFSVEASDDEGGSDEEGTAMSVFASGGCFVSYEENL